MPELTPTEELKELFLLFKDMAECEGKPLQYFEEMKERIDEQLKEEDEK